MATKIYSVSDLKRLVKESTNEFKPVLGKNVEKDNKSINDKAYKDVSKETANYSKELTKEPNKKVKYPQNDGKGMHNLKYDNINDNFKNRVKSQVKGYVSSDAEKKHKNDPYGNSDFDTIEGLEDHAKEMKKSDVLSKSIGLTSREIPKKEFEDLHQTVYEDKLMVVKFKNTLFLTENHMLSRVPDNFKVEGKKFIMKDKNNNEFLVEWHEEPKIINKTKINEQKNRIKELFNYKRSDSNTTNDGRLVEERKVSDMIGRARALMK